MPKIRLQKYCSEKGLASRRKTEEYIKAGLIKINGKIVEELGYKIDPEKDRVELCRAAIKEQEAFLYVLLNKPEGYVTNLPGRGEKEASTLLPEHFKKLHPAGRLDKDSTGLLLFTNDGVAAHRLTSPAFDHEKEYEVLVDRELSNAVIGKFGRGIRLLGEKLKPVRVKKIGEKTYRFILREGKNRQIRRMLNKFGYQVSGLKRVRILNLLLDGLSPGQFREITRQEKSDLLGFLR